MSMVMWQEELSGLPVKTRHPCPCFKVCISLYILWRANQCLGRFYTLSNWFIEFTEQTDHFLWVLLQTALSSVSFSPRMRLPKVSSTQTFSCGTQLRRAVTLHRAGICMNFKRILLVLRAVVLIVSQAPPRTKEWHVRTVSNGSLELT